MMESAAEVREALNVCQGTSSSLDVSHAGKHAMQTLSGCSQVQRHKRWWGDHRIPTLTLGTVVLHRAGPVEVGRDIWRY
jgi:hypothetical protein